MEREIREKCTALPTGAVGAAQVRQAPRRSTSRPWRWLAWGLWLFPVLMGLFGLGAMQWDLGQLPRTASDFWQAILPSPDIQTAEATLLAIERHTARREVADWMRVSYRFTAADDRTYVGEGYFERRDLPSNERMIVRFLASNPAISFPENGSRGLPGLWKFWLLWSNLLIGTLIAHRLLLNADRTPKSGSPHLETKGAQ